MAEPIKHIVKETKSAEQEQTEDIQAIMEQIAENRETIQDLLTIGRELHTSGALDIVKSLLVKRTEVSSIAMEQIDQPATLNILKNGMSGIGLLAMIEPEQLNRFFDGIKGGLDHVSEHRQDHKVGVWGALRATKDPHIKTSIQTMLNFLEGMGKKLSEDQKQ